MSELQVIQSTVQQANRRRRWECAWRGMWLGLVWAGAAWLVSLVVYKLTPVPVEVLQWGAALSGFLIAAGFLRGWLKAPSLLETARWLDSKEKLKERISTALEVSAKDRENAWTHLILRDAASAAGKLNVRKLLPIQLPRSTRWVFLLLMLAAGLGFVPEYRSKQFVQKQKDKDIIKATGRQLAELTRRTVDQRPPVLEPTRKALDEVAELGEHLVRGQMTKSEALRDLASASQKLKDQAKELGQNPALKNLNKAAKPSTKGGTPSMADLQKQIDALQKSLGQKGADSAMMDKFKNDLEKAKDAASQLAQKDGQAAEDAKEKLQQSLADLAKQSKDAGLSMPSLDEAIAALAKSQVDEVLKDLAITEIELEKMQAMAKALEKFQLQMEKLGKDLPEQLERGQAEAAQSTLQKMASALESGKVSSEELQKMMEEVERAVKPASEYGQVAAMLKDANRQMKAGQKSEAAQSLAKAAKELDKMMGELGDAQSILASLEALQTAQMCIANGQAWSDAKSAGKPRAGKGSGQSRGGVGTWTDEDSWVYPEFVDKWDNSGVVRDDMDGKGLSDRGDGQLADNLAATKIKGKITPGGQMPSVTLKGVSIKGTSKVDYREVVGAAQSEAQSALSQEQVPRAYQGAVRNYFDDLKQ